VTKQFLVVFQTATPLRLVRRIALEKAILRDNAAVSMNSAISHSIQSQLGFSDGNDVVAKTNAGHPRSDVWITA
jgi:hypothetical protein